MVLSLKIRSVPGTYAIARLAADAKIPEWMDGPGFTAVIKSDDEITLVCLNDRVPAGITAERNWACMRTIGPFPFESAGIVQSLIAPLSNNGIGIFVVCTFDGEHLLVQEQQLEDARRQLLSAGHQFDCC